MRRILLSLVLTATACTAALAQQVRGGAEARTDTSAHKEGHGLNIASGTRLAAQLENTLDVNRARVGDRVVLKTTEAIKSGGATVVRKGARLLGTVTDVRRSARGGAESSITLLFDRLESGSLSAPIEATVNSVTQLSAHGRADNDNFEPSAGARNDTSARGGSLLGGVTGAVGDVVGGATDAVGATASGVGRTLGQIRVTQSTDASVEGGSVLSLSGGNLRLEKGTTFRLTLSQSAGVNDDNNR